MAEYIELEAAYNMDTLYDWYISSVSENDNPVWTEEHLEELLNDFYVIPKDTPTVDAAPVKHGHWIYKKRTKLVSTGIARVAEDGAAVIMKKHITVKVPYCSICGERGDNALDATPFCPNCGARMDGDTDANGNDNKTLGTLSYHLR